MSKGVKGLWKVLKHRDPLPYSRQVDDDDIPSYWSKDDESNLNGTEDEDTSMMTASDADSGALLLSYVLMSCSNDTVIF